MENTTTTDTPETDAHWAAIDGSLLVTGQSSRKQMKKLERERNAARHERNTLESYALRIKLPVSVRTLAMIAEDLGEGCTMTQRDGYLVAFREDVAESTTPPTATGIEALVCECVNWCRDGRDMISPHHPRCEHHTPPEADSRFAKFGVAMWKYITRLGGDFCGEEISEDILPLAQSAGLCRRVAYNPEIHGEGIEADPGDEIWYWGVESKGGQEP